MSTRRFLLYENSATKSMNLLGKAKSKDLRRASDQILRLKVFHRSTNFAMNSSSDDGDNTSPARSAQETKWQPAYWQQHLQNIRVMRHQQSAPVDTVGCDKLHDPTAPLPIQRYQTLISLMMSSQTKDTTTAAAMRRLKAHGLTPQNVMQTSESTLETLMNPVSFYRRKAVYIKKSTAILLNQYNGDIPPTVEELMKLPGVGSKMAHLAVQAAWNKIEGIGVDTHVHRIANWLQWLPKPTKTPEATRAALESWLPRELWREINHLLVGFGQTICAPVRPRCEICLNKDICPYFRKTHRGIWRKQSFHTTADTEEDADAVEKINEAVSSVQTKIYNPVDVAVGEEIASPELLVTVSHSKLKRKSSSGGKAPKLPLSSIESTTRLHAPVAMTPTDDIEDAVSPYFAADPLADTKRSRSITKKTLPKKTASSAEAGNDGLMQKIGMLNEPPAAKRRSTRKAKKQAVECVVEKVCNDPVLDSPAIKGDTAAAVVVGPQNSRKKKKLAGAETAAHQAGR